MWLGQLDRKIGQWIYNIHRALNAIGTTVLFIMILLVAIDVIGRFLFNRPVKGSTDIVELMLLILVFFGLGYCAAVEGHVRVDVIYTRLPRRIQANLSRITFAAGAFTFGLITWQLGARAWSILLEPSTGPSTYTLLIPNWPFMFLAAIGSLFFCLELLIRVFHPLAHGQVKVDNDLT